MWFVLKQVGQCVHHKYDCVNNITTLQGINTKVRGVERGRATLGSCSPWNFHLLHTSMCINSMCPIIFQKMTKRLLSFVGSEICHAIIQCYFPSLQKLSLIPACGMSHFTGGWPLIGIPEAGPWSINSSYFFYQKAHGSDVFFMLTFSFNNIVMNNTYYVPVVSCDS